MTRWTIVLLAVTAALLAVPAALGVTRPDDRSGSIGTGAVAQAAVIRNAQERLVGVGRVTATSEPSWARTGGAVVEQPTGTDWAAILAVGAVVVLVVLAAGAAVELGHQHGGPARPIPH